MRPLFSILLSVLFLCGPASGQLFEAAGVYSCGTRLTPRDAEIAAYLERIGAYVLATDAPRYVPMIPVTIHDVRRSDGTGGMDPAHIAETLSDVNARVDDLGLQLVQLGSTRTIDDDGLFMIENELELDFLRVSHQVPNTLNIFFVEDLDLLFSDLSCATSTFSFQPTQGIVCKKHCTAQTRNRNTLSHEVGHYFDLYHTHETQLGAECPDGSNCQTAGDLVCDTPADPGLAGRLGDDCVYGDPLQRCGDVFNPDVTNLMSYSGRCGRGFTEGQKARALATLYNLRPALLDAGNPAIVWVDFSSDSLFPDGSPGEPFRTVQAGIDAVNPGGRVVMIAGSDSEAGTFDDPVVLDSFRGPVILGRAP